jgi:formylglycine-generating enzyme required for sulfatase activity
MPLYTLGYRGHTIRGVDCILPPICPVFGGIFIMGSDKAKDARANDNETLQYPIEVGPFAIGQHPVTVAEYACAVHAEAVREPPAVSQMGWQQQIARLDHPVVCVSWQDALAYVRWLAKTTGQFWRLPTEAEWEKAARWDAERQVSRIYPWGDTFDKTRSNTRASEIGTTTPVGQYPGGASPCGAQDMAGNVWEWTSSLTKPYPFLPADGREDLDSPDTRILRGGSWMRYAGYARAAYRNHNGPNNSDVHYGFRLALTPSGS